MSDAPGRPNRTSATPATDDADDADLTWDSVRVSNNIEKYAAYVEKHPTVHVEEIGALVDRFLRWKVAEAEEAGKKVIHNAKAIYPGVKSHSFMWIQGGELNLGFALFYSDPTNVLAVRTDSFAHFEGRGIAIAGDTVYCFGW